MMVIDWWGDALYVRCQLNEIVYRIEQVRIEFQVVPDKFEGVSLYFISIICVQSIDWFNLTYVCVFIFDIYL